MNEWITGSMDLRGPKSNSPDNYVRLPNSSVEQMKDEDLQTGAQLPHCVFIICTVCRECKRKL